MPGHTLVDRLLNRFDSLKTKRHNFEDTWQDLSDYVYLNSKDFLIDRGHGQRKEVKVYDTTAVHAARLLASTLDLGLTNTATKWAELEITGASSSNNELNKYLAELSDKVMDIFNSTESSFQSNIHIFYLSLVVFGTGCLFVEEDEKGVIQFSTIHLSQIYVSEDKYGMVDTVFRSFKLTARQAIQTWGEDNVSIEVIKKHEQDPDCEIEFLHIVAPSRDYDGHTKKPIVSFYVDADHRTLLSEGGFDTMPYVVARFEKMAGEVYGRSPAWNALPSIRLLNAIKKTRVRAEQMALHPPLLLSDDGVMMPLNTKPGGVIMGGLSLDGTRRVEPLFSGISTGDGKATTDEEKRDIRDAFFIDQLIFRDQGTPVTATEIIQRQEEKLRLLSPHIGRLENEGLNPVIDRVLGIMAGRGDLDDAPEELRGVNLNVNYKSPLAKLQKSGDLQAFQRFLQSIAPMAQMDPTILDTIDPEGTVRVLSSAAGLHPNTLRSPEEVAQIQEQRAQQQEFINQLEAQKAQPNGGTNGQG